MKYDTRFAAVVTLAIAGALASTISKGEAAPAPVPSSATQTVVTPVTTNPIQVDRVLDKINNRTVDDVTRTKLPNPNQIDPSILKGMRTVMCPW